MSFQLDDISPNTFEMARIVLDKMSVGPSTMGFVCELSEKKIVEDM